jgi:uncharacterized protein
MSSFFPGRSWTGYLAFFPESSPGTELARVALFLADIATMVKARRRLSVLKDAADNRILECALAGRAQAIVTGDKAFLALKEYRGVRVLSLAEYLETP